MKAKKAAFGAKPAAGKPGGNLPPWLAKKGKKPAPKKG